jgi:hypothetical protein
METRRDAQPCSFRLNVGRPAHLARLLSFFGNELPEIGGTYRNQKAQADQWDPQGRKIKRLADASGDPQTFADEALRLMGVRHST